MALRIPGRGLVSPIANGMPGDLFVVVHALPDSRFEHLGADLWRQEYLRLPGAVLGTELSVPTLEGPAKVVVPPATQPETVLRMKGKGLPYFGGGRRGDLLLRLRVLIPDHLSAAERKLYEQLRQLSS